MILAGQLRFSAQASLFPQTQPCLIGGYTSKRVLNGRSSQIGWHFGKMAVKRKSGTILFRFMYQMFGFIKALLCISDFLKFFPILCIHPNQVGNCLPENIQRMADWYILFFDLYTIAGYNLHKAPLLSFFPFFLPLNIRHYLISASITYSNCTIRWIPQMSSPQFPF